MRQLAKLFELDYSKLSTTLALLVLELILIDFVVLATNHDTLYIFSAIFGTLFVGLSDPGGTFKSRVGPMVFTGVAGALLAVLGFYLGTAAWGWVTAVTFIVTLLSGLSLKFGVHRFITSVLLNVWFVITLGLSSSYSQSHIMTNTWGQAITWLGGGALWIVVAFLLWLVHDQTTRPLIAAMPTDNTGRRLTKQMIAFAVIRALALAMAVAIPFKHNLAHGYWIPIATLLAMKPNLNQATLFSIQRIIGTLIGAALAVFLLWAISGKLGLIAATLILLANGAAIRFVNYVLYSAALAAGALIALDLFHPTSHTAEWERIWYTFVGLGIGVVVMFVAGTLSKRKTKASSKSASPHSSPPVQHLVLK